MYMWHKIKKAYEGGESIRNIAKTYNVSRNTVRKYVYGKDVPTFKKGRWYSKKTDGYERAIHTMLEKGYIGTRIFNELKKQGFKGSQSSVNRYVSVHRNRMKLNEKKTTRFETGPGEQMQYDWKEWRTTIGETSLTIYIHAIILSYSRKKYYVISLGITLNDILQAMHMAFESLGGCAKTMLVDNPAQLVTRHTTKNGVQYNESFLGFCTMYGIRPDACRPYRARTKGKVERPFYYLQEHFLRGNSWDDLSQMNADLVTFTQEYNDRVIKELSVSANDRFEEERTHLMPISSIHPTPMTTPDIRRVSMDGYIMWHKKLYPMPMASVGQHVQVRSILSQTITVSRQDGTVLGTWPRRLDGPYRVDHPDHIVINTACLKKKHRVRQGRMKLFIQTFQSNGHVFVEGMLESNPLETIYPQLEAILGLIDIYDKETIQMVLQSCIDDGQCHKEGVMQRIARYPMTSAHASHTIGAIRPCQPISRSLSVYATISNGSVNHV